MYREFPAGSRPVNGLAPPGLRDEHFTERDRDLIAQAGNVIAAVVADLGHHHLGDGCWDLYGGTAEEFEHLADVVGRVEAAAREARQLTAEAHRAARLRARRQQG